MNKCERVRHPCKICLRGVTTKTGVQCQGVCKKWAHFKCLNYTQAKIQDIKAGIIKITCPCPDCNTSEPKELLNNSPYTCTNFQCPAHSLPTCESTDCPSMYHMTKKPILPERSPSDISTCIKNPICPPKRCDLSSISPPPLSWTSDPLPPVFSKKCDLTPCIKPSSPRCPHPSNPCPKCVLDTRLENKLCSPIRSLSCSFVARESCGAGSWSQNESCNIACDTGVSPKCISSSDSHITKSKESRKSLYCTIEQMCTTVGQLSDQLKELMCRMMDTFEKTRR